MIKKKENKSSKKEELKSREKDKKSKSEEVNKRTEQSIETGGEKIKEKIEEVIDQIISKGIIGSRRKPSEDVKKIDAGKDKFDNSIKTPFAYLLREVSKYPLLSPEEEKRLARRFRKYKDKNAARRLALANLRFVIKIALEYKNWGIPVEDLVSEGIMGLLFAIKKFDPEKGVKFISYASYWIKAFIHNYILSNFSIMKLGTTQDERRIFANIFKIKDETREEDIQKQAQKLNVDEEKIRLMDARVRSRDISLDSPQDDEGSLKLADILKAEETYDPLFKVEMEDAKEFIYRRLNDAFLHLTSQERQVIQQRYLSPKPKTLKELSDELKISKERIRQVEKRAFQKLKTALAQYAQTFRIDMLKDKIRRKRRTKEEMELIKMIEEHTKKRKKRRKRKITKIEPERTEFFDLREI
ncbi:MAG: RNA polymerase factor sigma-32 [Candidatus Calescibacterium sp.]|jgi:alternative sigma factor RpoH|nr:RNA polymerase factor sigma-32 [Candidatus Calescibacterium sp.]